MSNIANLLNAKSVRVTLESITAIYDDGREVEMYLMEHQIWPTGDVLWHTQDETEALVPMHNVNTELTTAYHIAVERKAIKRVQCEMGIIPNEGQIEWLEGLGWKSEWRWHNTMSDEIEVLYLTSPSGRVFTF